MIIQRMQDLPEEAFFSLNEAARLLDRGDRSILALSYRWLTAAHPDITGTALAAVRRYLNCEADELATYGVHEAIKNYNEYNVHNNPDVGSETGRLEDRITAWCDFPEFRMRGWKLPRQRLAMRPGTTLYYRPRRIADPRP